MDCPECGAPRELIFSAKTLLGLVKIFYCICEEDYDEPDLTPYEDFINQLVVKGE